MNDSFNDRGRMQFTTEAAEKSLLFPHLSEPFPGSFHLHSDITAVSYSPPPCQAWRSR